VVGAVLSSPEFYADPVTSLYIQFLQRAPDSFGFNLSMQALGNGFSEEERTVLVPKQFSESRENAVSGWSKDRCAAKPSAPFDRYAFCQVPCHPLDRRCSPAPDQPRSKPVHSLRRTGELALSKRRKADGSESPRRPVILVVDDGREAVAFYRKHGAGIDLVLPDVRMPELDGPQTLAALRKENPTRRSDDHH
jgi:hypothetical protein